MSNRLRGLGKPFFFRLLDRGQEDRTDGFPIPLIKGISQFLKVGPLTFGSMGSREELFQLVNLSSSHIPDYLLEGSVIVGKVLGSGARLTSAPMSPLVFPLDSIADRFDQARMVKEVYSWREVIEKCFQRIYDSDRDWFRLPAAPIGIIRPDMRELANRADKKTCEGSCFQL